MLLWAINATLALPKTNWVSEMETLKDLGRTAGFGLIALIGTLIPMSIALACAGLILFTGWMIFAMAWLTYQW